VAPTELDLAHPKANWNKTAGYTEAETTAFRDFLNPPKKNAGDGGGDDSKNGKFVDLWRDLHPGERRYTYFSYRFNCRMKGIGWRIDGCKFLILPSHRNKFIEPFHSCGERSLERKYQNSEHSLDLWRKIFCSFSPICSV
jgi:exonuclease III